MVDVFLGSGIEQFPDFQLCSWPRTLWRSHWVQTGFETRCFEFLQQTCGCTTIQLFSFAGGWRRPTASYARSARVR